MADITGAVYLWLFIIVSVVFSIGFACGAYFT